MRSLENELRTEESYEFVKFMLILQGLKDCLNDIGIVNLIPVGSAVTKTIRRDSFMIDVILNFNQASIFAHLREQHENISEEQLSVRFAEIVKEIESLFRTRLAPRLCATDPTFGTAEYAAESQQYEITSQITEPLLAQICMFNLVSEQRLNARFFLQNITQVDTYFSIKHWFGMQRALSLYTGQSTTATDLNTLPNKRKVTEESLERLSQQHASLCHAKMQVTIKLLKQWRVKQDLCHVVYPEVIDSVLLMLLA